MRRAHRIRARLMSWSLALLAVLPGQQMLRAQSVSEYQVKAAYLYNFAKFVEWPKETLNGDSVAMRLCVLNDTAFGMQLSNIVAGKAIKNHPIVVVPVTTGEESRTCQLLFIGSSQNRQTKPIIDVLQGTSALTVGETKGFLEAGGMVNFVLQDNQVRFQVNHGAATRAGLRMSSKLLSLAKLVVE